MLKKVLFLHQIFEMEILMDLHVLRSSESENDTFGLSPSVCVRERENIFRVIQKQIAAKTPNLIFYSCIILNSL